MRQIVLDTETTGLSVRNRNRVIEIGCVELVDGMTTGSEFHRYINPERDVDEDSFRVHGISSVFLKEFPVFRDVVDPFLEFIQDSQLIIHNARFDMEFLNFELKLLERPELTNSVVDTLAIARQKFPGSPANLNALCKMFQIYLSHRTYHGALLDAKLLTQVYIELTGGPQISVFPNASAPFSEDQIPSAALIAKEEDSAPRVHAVRKFTVTEAERASHEQLLKKISATSWQSAS